MKGTKKRQVLALGLAAAMVVSNLGTAFAAYNAGTPGSAEKYEEISINLDASGGKFTLTSPAETRDTVTVTAKASDSNATVGNFSDANKAHDIAQEMYNKKADIIFQAAGKSGQGVFKAAQEINQARPVGQKVWVIGSDEDQSKLGDYLAKGGQPSNFTLTSVIKSADLAVEDIATQTASGKFPGGKTLKYGLKNKGISLVQGNLSYHTWIKVQKAKQKIIDGKIKVGTD